MNSSNSTNDLLSHADDSVPVMSSGLKTLTVLTFIGCTLQLLSALWNFINAEKSYKGLDKLVEQMNADNVPSIVKSMVGDTDNLVAMITKGYENRIPIVLMAIVAVGLCFFGALQMRKLKKQGFLFYTIGEILPFVSQALFIGLFSFSGIVFYLVAALSILFIVLYAMQRKHLVY